MDDDAEEEEAAVEEVAVVDPLGAFGAVAEEPKEPEVAEAAPAVEEKKLTKAEKKALKKGKGSPEKAEKKVETKEEKARKKLEAKCDKEGGKKGVEIEGECDMGGLAFFCTKLDEPDGDMELLRMGFNAMIAEPDPTAEERRGGAGRVGMVVFSAGQTQLAMCCNVPKERQVDPPNIDPAKPAMEAMNAKEWVEYICAPWQGKVKVEITGDADYAEATAQADMDAGFFAIKMKDEAMKTAYALLNERHCFD